MRLNYKNILLLIYLLSSMVLLGQYEDAPYKFDDYLSIQVEFVTEGCLYKKNVPNLICVNNQEDNRKIELRITDINYQYIDNVLFNSDSCEVLKHFAVQDFDNDGLHEIIVPLRYKNRIDYFLYNPGDSLHNKVVFSINGTRNSHYLQTFFYFINLDSDAELEVVIPYCENYPESGSVRGVFAFDIRTGEQLWFYPMASYFNKIRYKGLDKNHNISFCLATSGANNGLVFSNNTYFFRTDDGNFKPYKTYYTNINSETPDTSADDFSSDSRSTIIAINKDGKKLWERYLGGEYVWSTATCLDNENLLFGEWRRSRRDSNYLGKVGIINSSNGAITKYFVPDEKIYTSNSTYFNQIVVMGYHLRTYIYNSDFELIWDSGEEPYLMNETFLMNSSIYYWASTNVGINEYQVILNSQFNTIAAINGNSQIEYLPKTDLFKIYNSKNESLFKLQYVPWYNRISANTLWIVVLSIAGLVILVLVLWGLTMHHASKRIHAQKLELELATAKLIESEKLALLGTIASSLAHELNSPLGAIKNSAQRLLKGKLSEKDNLGNIELIYKAVNNSAALIQKFLNQSRVKNEENISNVKSVYDEWKLMFGRQYELLGIHIDAKLNDNYLVAMPATELNQAINNVMSNAKDALIECNNDDKLIRVTVEEINDFIALNIEDTGKGFEKEMLEVALEPFQTTKKKGHGTGLGLWIVKQILDHHGGTIKIISKEKGSRIVINIPKYSGTYEKQV